MTPWWLPTMFAIALTGVTSTHALDVMGPKGAVFSNCVIKASDRETVTLKHSRGIGTYQWTEVRDVGTNQTLKTEFRARTAPPWKEPDLRTMPTNKVTELAVSDSLTEEFMKALSARGPVESNRLVVATINDNKIIVALRVRDNFTKGFIESGFQFDAWTLLKKAFENATVQEVEISGCFPITDKYGNRKIQEIASIQMPRREYEKINQENFLPHNLQKFRGYIFAYE